MEEQRDISTARLVGRTAGITLFSLVMALFLVCNIVALASPRLVSRAANRISWGGPAVSFARAQYERTKDGEDLAELCETTIRFSRYDLSERYLEELLGYEREGVTFADLAARRDQAYGYDYAAYIRANYAEALYRRERKAEALAFAELYTPVYAAVSPLAYYVDAFVDDAARNAEDGLLEALLRREAAAAGAEQRLLWVDLYRVCTALGDAERAGEYEDKLLSQNH